MTKKILVLAMAVALLCSAKAFSADTAKASAKTKVVETRINEADMDRLASAVNRAVKEAVIAKQGPSGFEYMAKRMKPPKNEKWQGKWNDLGSEGWEAVDHFENIYIFKRAALGVAAAAPAEKRMKPAAAPAKAEEAAPSDDKAAKKAAKEEEKAAKKVEKDKEKAAKKAEKDAKKAQKDKEKAAKKAEKDAKKKAE